MDQYPTGDGNGPGDPRGEHGPYPVTPYVLPTGAGGPSPVGSTQSSYHHQSLGAAYPPPGYPYPPPSINGLAIAALVISLIGGFFAIPFGHAARRQIHRTGQQGGGLALAGLIIGYLSLTASVIAASVFGYLAYVVNDAVTQAQTSPVTAYSSLGGGGLGQEGSTSAYPSSAYPSSAYPTPTYSVGSSGAYGGTVTVPGADVHGFLTDRGARCNASDLAVAIAQTNDSNVSICTTTTGGLYYRGSRRSDGASLEIDFPTRIGNTFTATNNGTRYVLTPTTFTIAALGGTPIQGAVTDYWAP